MGSSELRVAFERFKARGLLRAIDVGGIPVPYAVAGAGDRTLVVLPGAVGSVESTFVFFLELESTYRIAAVGYPAVTSMADLVSAVAAVLDREGVSEATILGGSYGAAVAQSFARRFPEHVQKLILAHGSGPSPERGRRTRRFLKLLPFLPMPLLRLATAAASSKLLPRETPERDFWKAHLTESFAGLTKKDLDARYRCILEYEDYRFSPEDLPSTPVLIIDSNDDPLVRPPDREALKALYQKARVHTFDGAGHVSSLLRREEYFRVIRSFVES